MPAEESTAGISVHNAEAGSRKKIKKTYGSAPAEESTTEISAQTAEAKDRSGQYAQSAAINGTETETDRSSVLNAEIQ